MRNFILILSLWLFPLCTFAINISNEIKLFREGQAISTVDSEYVVLDKDVLTFSLEQQNYDVDWKFLMYKSVSPDTLVEVLKSSELSNSFVLDLAGIDWSERFYCFTFENDPNLYYKGIVQISNNGVVEDELCITLNLLPSRLIIENVSFEYVYDWDEDVIFPNGKLAVEIRTGNRGQDEFVAWYSECCIFEQPRAFYYGVPFNINANVEELTMYTDDAVDWGMYMFFRARNQYGYTFSDTIYTTDYITDAAVLARLKEIEKERMSMTGDNISNSDKYGVALENGELLFKGDLDSVLTVDICDVAGKLLRHQNNGNAINLADMSRGCYIARYKTNSGIFIFKFIKL